MSTIVRTRLVRIGNSHGVRIPKVILDQLKLTDAIELELLDDQLILRPSKQPRAGWAEQFEQMALAHDDRLLDDDLLLTATEEEDWVW